jgi:methanogenic corrinoid protein MtbC1
MPTSSLDRYLSPLLAGNRIACRRIVRAQLEGAADPTSLYHELLWPAMEKVDKLFRSDRINSVVESMATRINRSIADQLQPRLQIRDPNGKRILIASAPGENEELGAQMCADLFEARGWEVYLIGGSAPNDEILNLCGELRPDILLIFGTRPQGVPAVRHLVDQIREIGVNPTMNIMVSGGVYNRADGLWKEVNADLFAKTAKDAIPIAECAEPRKPAPPRTGAPKKRRRRRRPPLLAAAKG